MELARLLREHHLQLHVGREEGGDPGLREERLPVHRGQLSGDGHPVLIPRLL